MCMLSVMLSDFARLHPGPMVTTPAPQPLTPFPVPFPWVTREEFDALRRDVEELKKLIPAVRAYDANTGQPDCEHAEKVAIIKKLAELVGVDLDEVLKQSPE